MPSNETAFPLDKCYPEIFESQASATPNATALTFQGQSLTYKELNERSNGLAHFLMKAGVKPEVIVAVLGERSIDFWTIVLSILKAGGVYLPLNPYHPAKGHHQVLELSKPLLVIFTPAFEAILKDALEYLPSEDRPRTLCSIEVLEGMSSEERPSNNCTPNDLSCLLFTSGSTGKPKGAMVEHKGMLNHIYAKLTDMDIRHSDTVAQNGPQSFDVSIWQALGVLLVGGRVQVFSDEIASDPAGLIREVTSNGVTILEVVPSQLRMMLEEISRSAVKADFSKLRWIVPTGETLPVELVRRWFSLYPQIPVLNTYGTTECTDDVAHYPIFEMPASDISNIPIGRPILNMSLYALDSSMRQLSTGIAGELFVGGVGVGRGYLNDPERTAKSFIADIFSSRKGDRLYKTGDLARCLPDGNFEFLGRIDHQVKINGIRIEPGEIQAVLETYPKVRTSLVVDYEDKLGKKRLVAYVVVDSEAPPTKKELFRFLRDRLPSYLVPADFVFLKEMPLTLNSKIDRSALPPWDENQRASQISVIRPRTSTEATLISICQQILGVDNIDIYDNYFDLGGDSLLATELIVEIREEFNLELSWNTIYTAPHFARLAQLIDTEMRMGAQSTILENGTQNPAGDVRLDFRIESDQAQYVTQPNNILLTGATGFVGSNLLRQLLEETKADIYCLVRTKHQTEGKKRIIGSLQSRSLWNDEYDQRIIPVIGDLAKKSLGLTAEQFSEIASRVEVIYHNGALVNFIYPYSLLKKANVYGTHEVLKFAGLNTIKPVHFISTFSIFSLHNNPTPDEIRETDIPTRDGHFDSGYAQSKWVAERLVMEARNQGLPTCIYRLGTIMGHSRTGICNTNDWFCRLVVGCIQTGKAPNLDVSIPITTVDYTCRSIAYLAKQESSFGKVFHIVNPYSISWTALVDQLRSFGYPIDQVPYSEWRDYLLHYKEKNLQDSLHFLLHLFQQEAPHEVDRLFDDSNTVAGLAGSGINPESDVTTLVARYVSYLDICGFLTKR